MKFNNETRAFGSIRKTRRWGTCGVILGLATLGLMTSPVRADERVNPNPATNAKSLQDSPTVDSTKDQGSAEKSTGSVEVTVNREKVEFAVSAAKEAGLIVKETEVDGGLVTNPDVLAKKTAEIESTYEKQATTVVNESKKYKEEVETRKEEIKTITAENNEKQDSYNKAKAQYDKDLADATTKNAQIDKENQEKNERLKAEKERVAKENERIKQENTLAKSNYDKAIADKAKKDAEIDKENALAKKNYEEALKTWTHNQSQSDADLTKYKEQLAQYQKDLAEAKRKNEEIAKKNLSDKDAYVKAVEARRKENEAILQANKTALDAYEKALADLKLKNEQIDKDNAKSQDEYNKALLRYQTAHAQYESNLADYNRKLAALRTQRVQGSANGVTIYGEFDESKRGSLEYYSRLTAVFDSSIPNLEVVDGSLGANANTTMSLDKDLEHDRLENKDFYGHSDSKGTYGGSVITGIKQGSTFTLHDIGKTKTGKTISARFVARNTPIPEHKIAGNPSTYTRLNVWWNKVTNEKDVSSVNFNPYNYLNVEWDIHYFDEKSGKAIDLGLITIYSDLDYAQAVRHTYGDNGVGVVINPTDSLVKETTVNGQTHWMGVKTDGVYKHNDPSGLERYKIGDPDYIDVDDYRATPEGTIVSAGHGSIQHLTYLARGDKPLHTYTESQSASYRKYWNDERRANGQQDDNDDEIFAAGYTFQVWGGRSVVNQLVPPSPLKIPIQPSLIQKNKDTIEKPTPKPLLPEIPPVSDTGEVPLPKEPPKPDEFTNPRPDEPEYKEKDKTPLTPPTEKPLLASPKDEPDKPHVPIPSEPPTPDLKPVPNEVAPREVEVTYTRLRTTPTVEKLVKNSAGTNVNNSSVPKLSEVVWELETKPLVANRKKTTIYELTDNLPQGYQLDLAKTVAQNQDFTVTYDKDKHQLKGSLKAEGLVKVNTDLSKAYKAPVLKVYGTVTNDGATYKNNFHLNLNNEFESYSNIVKVTTPGKPNDPDNPNNNLIKPLKHNHNKDGVIIDGKTVLAGSTNYYHITLDYDQYKGIKADPSAILKGFGAIDDYPEEAVTINKSDIRYIDSEGKEVSGISVYQYDSIEAVDNDKVKAFLDSSEIKPKGAFQVFLVDDPEAYFKQYIKAGKSVTIIDPMVTKEELRNTGKSFENTAYQVDFGNGYKTDTVVNNVPTVKPTKKNLNKEGVNIDGKQVLAGSVNYYKVTADYSQYKGIEADKDRIGKGFYIVDDYPEEAVTINQDGVQVTDSKGQVVKGLRATIYESLDKAPVGVQESLKKQGFIPKGAIQVFKAENQEEYYKTYVQTGEVLTITNPMTVKKELGQTGGKYENTAYQVDFGIAYVTETVVNNVPKIEPKKDVVIDHLSKESLDGKDVRLNQTFNYKLVGSLIPKDRSEQLFEYKFRDDYDETHDDYQSIYQVFATVDFETSDGQKFKAGDELTKFTSQVVDKAKGKVDISFDDAFLKSILETLEFQAEAYLQMTRIQSGTVENTYSHTVNGVEVVSNTVVTHTPEEPKTPEEHPQQPERSLPSTGEQASAELLLAGLAMGGTAAGLLYSKRKKKEA
ncbi:SspB-related isopeptide-forming adhesin [Streptococcus mitis]|jgi:LPXTG-motif cell wall anchor domain protein|uniref:SspB-related isopeptide-forming adhesin n=1 Tax=Streptococcus mitis TaxID=28037 RepID=UPI0021B6BB6C|nr:SspB-related isopeptide-forming adhesin [Streptococcus mitis]MDK6635708.1 LPXTG cell wall anchor domain-containing protein [Streptococcus mitis]MDK7132327.1 LPXTG cell wall anchor domain-containing protein [Streptococcus mitis]